MAEKFFEVADLVPAFVPVDMQTANNTGDWVNLSLYHRCIVCVLKAVGTGGNGDVIFNLQQATDNAASDVKDINFSVIFSRLAVDVTTVAAFTRNTQTAATSYTDATSAEKGGFICVEILAENLDAANDFTHIRLDVADTGTAANLGCGFYIMLDPIFNQQTPPDATA